MNRFSYALMLLLALFLTSCEQDENKKIEEQARQLNKENKAKLQVTPVSLNTTAFIEEMFQKQLEADTRELPITIDNGVSLIEVNATDEAIEYVYQFDSSVNAAYVNWDAFDDIYMQGFLRSARATDILNRYCVRKQIPIKYIVLDSRGSRLHTLNIPVETIMQAG